VRSLPILPYSYGYAVRSRRGGGPNFGHRQTATLDKNNFANFANGGGSVSPSSSVSGSYHVLLPDGRTQVNTSRNLIKHKNLKLN
jgi:hypothetical protein